MEVDTSKSQPVFRRLKDNQAAPVSSKWTFKRRLAMIERLRFVFNRSDRPVNLFYLHPLDIMRHLLKRPASDKTGNENNACGKYMSTVNFENILGAGSFGIVLRGCSTIREKREKIGNIAGKKLPDEELAEICYAVKLSSLSRETDSDEGAYIELLANSITTYFVKLGICPNFLTVGDSYMCEFPREIKEKFPRNKVLRRFMDKNQQRRPDQKRWLIAAYELANGNLGELWDIVEDVNEETFVVVILNIMHAFDCIQRYFRMNHYDSHSSNILLLKLNKDEIRTRKEEIAGIKFNIPGTEYLPILWDFGFATFDMPVNNRGEPVDLERYLLGKEVPESYVRVGSSDVKNETNFDYQRLPYTPGYDEYFFLANILDELPSLDQLSSELVRFFKDILGEDLVVAIKEQGIKLRPGYFRGKKTPDTWPTVKEIISHPLFVRYRASA